MKKILLLILVMLCGGTPAPAGEPAPSIEGALEVTIGKGRSIVAPPGSATAGSRWIEHSISYKNTSKASVWIVGYAETYPFIGIQTRAKADEPWQDYPTGYCGTGAEAFEIAPGKAHTFIRALPEKYAGQEFRVSLPFGLPGGKQKGEAVSPPVKLHAD